MQNLQSLEKAKSFFISGLEKLNSNNLPGAEIDFEASLKFVPERLSTLINLSIALINNKKQFIEVMCSNRKPNRNICKQVKLFQYLAD